MDFGQELLAAVSRCQQNLPPQGGREKLIFDNLKMVVGTWYLVVGEDKTAAGVTPG